MAQTKILSGNLLHRKGKVSPLKTGKSCVLSFIEERIPPYWRKGIIYLGELSADKGLRSSFAGGEVLSTVR
jgi:hypothetical protein